jgi:hypothetical protein
MAGALSEAYGAGQSTETIRCVSEGMVLMHHPDVLAAQCRDRARTGERSWTAHQPHP